MFTKILVVAILIGIIGSLATALVFMVRDGGSSPRTAKALTVRISISVALFVLLFILWWAGVITPHGVTR